MNNYSAQNDCFTAQNVLVLRTQSVSTVFCPAVFFHNCPVLQLDSITSYEKREQVQQANVFKCQTLTFDFSMYRPIHLNILSYHMLVTRRPLSRQREMP